MKPFDPDNEAILFLHMPKCAGRSFASVIRRNVSDDVTYPYDKWQSFVSHADQAGRFGFFRGHLFYELKKMIPKPTRIVSIFRDPAERLYSEYKYILRTPGHARHDRVLRSSFEQFLETPGYLRTYVRFLTARPDVASGTADFSKMIAVKDSAKALALAKKRVDMISVVGLTEMFEESIRRLEGEFGWNPGPIPYANAAPPDDRDVQKNIALARAKLEKDAPEEIEIYEYVKARFLESQSK